MRPNTFTERQIIGIYKFINKYVPWHKLPVFLGEFNLLAFRLELRAKNLEDVYPSAEFQGTSNDPKMEHPKYMEVRNPDGLFNSLEQPKMGCTGMRFGRNVPRSCTKPPTEEELMTPNPRVVSETLMARDEFKPATIINLLAAAWIQFQTHDWFFHNNSTTESHEVPLPPGCPFQGPMKIEKTQADEPLDDNDKKYPAYKNANTHWWDGSQLYGSSESQMRVLRGSCENGKLTMEVNKFDTFLPTDDQGQPITGFYANWWIGLEMLHTLFSLEHNTICDKLVAEHPAWTGDKIFDTARMINCALMAKIHTVEWTPAILKHPTLQAGMNTNWWGVLGENLNKLFGHIGTGDIISGIPGSKANQDNVPFTLTEEFVSVYRLHTLIPDNIALFHIDSGVHAKTEPISGVAFTHARDILADGQLKWADVFFSFGINYPGAVTTNNHPAFLRDLHMPDGRHLDMATLDLVRDRERGVPRYNEFRRLFHLKPASTFLELTGGNEILATKVEAVYEGKIEEVDLQVGCLCEPLPAGFGFSDTAFRVFILMASRRLTSDRFLSTSWNKETYTKTGIDWVQNSSMKDVLCRHFPELAEPLKGVKNAFAPWTKVGRSAEYTGVETTVGTKA